MAFHCSLTVTFGRLRDMFEDDPMGLLLMGFLSRMRFLNRLGDSVTRREQHAEAVKFLHRLNRCVGVNKVTCIKKDEFLAAAPTIEPLVLLEKKIYLPIGSMGLAYLPTLIP